MSSYKSIKWISSQDTSNGRKMVAHDVSTALPDSGKVQKRGSTVPVNLISIFGRARQGKSFLMNCLAGETNIFKISNEKESCTQGIDLSSKWLSLRQFSTIDSGKGVDGPAMVGFVDAEGQGDRDVSYDAKLVCPILLTSKCVIFNWKGDLQKDHLLSSLGIMARAASNVDAETPSDSSTASARAATSSHGNKKKFGHLHIVFRDWQAVSHHGGSSSRTGSSNTDPVAASVFHDLFTEERGMSDETSNRNQIRRDLLASFESVEVWLFDPPTESTAALRQILTYSVASTTFKQQIRAFRQVLSGQLQHFTPVGGTALTTSTINPFIQNIVLCLNQGQAILPSSIYLNMIQQELTQKVEVIEGKIKAVVTSNCETIKKSLDQQKKQLAIMRRQCDDHELIGCNEEVFDSDMKDQDKLLKDIQQYMNGFLTIDEAFTHITAMIKESIEEDMLDMQQYDGAGENRLYHQIIMNTASKLESLTNQAIDQYMTIYQECLVRYVIDLKECSTLYAHKALESVYNYVSEKSIDQSNLKRVLSLIESIVIDLAGCHHYKSAIKTDDIGNSFTNRVNVDDILEGSYEALTRFIESKNAAIIKQNEDTKQKIESRFEELLNSSKNKMNEIFQQYFDLYHGKYGIGLNSSTSKERATNTELLEPLRIQEIETYLNTHYLDLKQQILSDKILSNERLTEMYKLLALYCSSELMPVMHQKYQAIVDEAIHRIYETSVKYLHESLNEQEVEEMEVESPDDLRNQLTDIKNNIINHGLSLSADWLVSSECESSRLIGPLESIANNLIEGFVHEMRTLIERSQQSLASKAARQSTSSTQTDTKRKETKSSTKASAKAPSSTDAKSNSERDKAKAFAISQGWITESKVKSPPSKKASKQSSGPTKVLSKTQEDVAKARQKAKDWALKQGIKVSEDTPWSSKADPGIYNTEQVNNDQEGSRGKRSSDTDLLNESQPKRARKK